jgi:hypothetical protein
MPKNRPSNSYMLYIIYIELGYGVLQITKVLCALRSIINFKSEMIDSNAQFNIQIKIY